MINKLKSKLIYKYVVKEKCDYDETIDYINGLNAQQIINETETEPFTPQERADLNLSKCLKRFRK